jgi:hypothetical protein
MGAAVDTNQVTADATVALAVVGAGALIANAVVAVFTLRAARATQRSASATEEAAKATHDEAEATKQEAAASLQVVEEMPADRELTFRPFLSWVLDGTINASNNGRGPALNSVFCGLRDDGTWLTTLPRLIDFGPGDHIPSGAYSMLMSELTSEAPPTPSFSFPVRKLAFCEDQLGNRYRFIQGSVKPDVWKPGRPKPDWVSWFEKNAPIAKAE